jgi:2-dehydro-3-deoxy-D-arabinonate dehydratase
MHIVRYAETDTRRVRVGTLEDGQVRPLEQVDTVAELLARPLEDLRAFVTSQAVGEPRPVADVRLLPPVDGLTEVWASGVTYERSMDARVEESVSQDVYTRVYSADRPELFFKAPAWRVVTDGEPIAVRDDSAVTVPEPELALVVTAHGEVAGYTVCNDVSSRDIEGENPLYIPQAKTYAGSCALAPGIRPAWEVPDPTALGIRVQVVRGGETVFEGSTGTDRIHRSLDDLVEYLVRALAFPAGAVLATGTGVVPELDFTLRPGDRVDIDIEEVGSLSNPVDTAGQSLRWTVDALADPFARPSEEVR